MIWNRTDLSLVPNQSEDSKYNLISVWFNKISVCTVLQDAIACQHHGSPMKDPVKPLVHHGNIVPMGIMQTFNWARWTISYPESFGSTLMNQGRLWFIGTLWATCPGRLRITKRTSQDKLPIGRTKSIGLGPLLGRPPFKFEALRKWEEFGPGRNHPI